MRTGILGINHRLADLDLREVVAKSVQILNHTSIPHILLSTCNRTEIYFEGDEHSNILSLLDLPEESLQRFYSFFDHDCFRHLCRVTAGLDSAVVGETEIQGQVKRAYEEANVMHELFQRALFVGKKVRSQLDLRPGLADTESIVADQVSQSFPKDCRLLFVGDSEINAKIRERFVNRGYTQIETCNRTPKEGMRPWSHLEKWDSYDVAIFGTKAPGFVVKKRKLDRVKLVIDLSVPRNVDPSINVKRLYIDDVHKLCQERRHLKHHVVDRAEAMIEAEVSRWSLLERAQ